MGVQWGGKWTFLTCSAPYSTDQILGQRCVRGCGSNNLQSETVIFLETWSPAQVLILDNGIKINVREAINFDLNKLNFEDIRENQSKVVEAYLRACKDWSSAVLCKSEVMRVKFVKIRPFTNKAEISSGSKNSGPENSFKNCLFYLQRIHDVISVISR